MSKPTHLSLFTGIGGIDLAAEWAGFETVGQCEWAEYPRKVLEKHWPEVPRWKDIRTLTGESFYERTGLRTVDIISGGFPCQPFSVAGKRKGKEDDRYLWPEMLRVIQELKPTWVLGENVENAVRMVLDDIIDDLEGNNYATQAFVVSAYCAGAWFSGRRTFIVATPNDRGSVMRWDAQFQTDAKIEGSWNHNRGRTQEFDTGERWPLESRPSGVVDWCANRVDRLKCLANAVVPQQVYPILRGIRELIG